MSASSALSVKSAEPIVNEPASLAALADGPGAEPEDEPPLPLEPQAASASTTGSARATRADLVLRYMVLLCVPMLCSYAFQVPGCSRFLGVPELHRLLGSAGSRASAAVLRAAPPGRAGPARPAQDSAAAGGGAGDGVAR